MNKKTLSERDICTKFITSAIEKAGWDKNTQLLEEVSFTVGKIFVRGKLAVQAPPLFSHSKVLKLLKHTLYHFHHEWENKVG